MLTNGDSNANDTAPEFESTESGVGAPNGQQPGGQQDGQMPDFAAAAQALGITEEALMNALGNPSQGSPDFAAAAEALGITEEALIEALGIPAGGMSQGGGQPPARTP